MWQNSPRDQISRPSSPSDVDASPSDVSVTFRIIFRGSRPITTRIDANSAPTELAFDSIDRRIEAIEIYVDGRKFSIPHHVSDFDLATRTDSEYGNNVTRVPLEPNDGFTTKLFINVTRTQTHYLIAILDDSDDEILEHIPVAVLVQMLRSTRCFRTATEAQQVATGTAL